MWFPKLAYSAVLLGFGSGVPGYGDKISADPMWGPRFYLFLGPDALPLRDEILRVLSRSICRVRFGATASTSPHCPTIPGTGIGTRQFTRNFMAAAGIQLKGIPAALCLMVQDYGFAQNSKRIPEHMPRDSAFLLISFCSCAPPTRCIAAPQCRSTNSSRPQRPPSSATQTFQPLSGQRPPRQ